MKMTKLTVVVFVCLVLIASLHSAMAIKCYVCAKCNDPFKKDGNATQDCGGVCTKLKVENTGDVIRGCVPTSMKSECKTVEEGGVKGTVCTCDKDLCNGSDVIKVATATGIMAIIAILINLLRFISF